MSACAHARQAEDARGAPSKACDAGAVPAQHVHGRPGAQVAHADDGAAARACAREKGTGLQGARGFAPRRRAGAGGVVPLRTGQQGVRSGPWVELHVVDRVFHVETAGPRHGIGVPHRDHSVAPAGGKHASVQTEPGRAADTVLVGAGTEGAGGWRRVDARREAARLHPAPGALTPAVQQPRKYSRPRATRARRGRAQGRSRPWTWSANCGAWGRVIHPRGPPRRKIRELSYNLFSTGSTTASVMQSRSGQRSWVVAAVPQG